MKIALVGNNDGPLLLYKSMREKDLKPLFIGLQKKPRGELLKAYLKLPEDIIFFYQFEELRLLDQLQDLHINLIINCFCNFKFKDLLDKYKVWNVHLSKLPSYRGRHPIHWALINGEKEIGISIHKMTREFDAGDILWQERINIDENYSVAQTRLELMQLLENDFGNLIENYKNKQLNIRENSKLKASYIPRRFPKDSKLVEWGDRDLIYRKIMALSSETNPAYLQINEEEIPIFSAEKVRSAICVPGEVIRILEDGLEVAGKGGENIILKGFNPQEYNFKLKLKLL